MPIHVRSDSTPDSTMGIRSALWVRARVSAVNREVIQVREWRGVTL